MAHVFISYKREEKVFALELKQQLEKDGFDVWIDENIRPGRKWRDEIDDKLRQAFAVVLIVTPQSMKSPYVTYEWIFALGANVEVVPVYLQAIKRFPYRLEDIQYVDFRSSYSWNLLNIRLHQVQSEHIAHEPLQEAKNNLNTSDPEKQRHGIEALIHMDARSELAEAVQHPNKTVSVSAAFGLCRVSNYTDDRAIPGLFKALKDEQWSIRYDAARALGRLKNPIAVPELVAILKDTVGDVRLAAVNSLGQIGNAEAIPGLLSALHDSMFPLIPSSAADALAQIGLPALDSLLEILNDENTEGDIQKAIIHALGKIGDKKATTSLLKKTYSKYIDICVYAIKALGKIKDANAIPRLIEILRGEDEEYADASTIALGDLGDMAIASLVEPLKSPNWHVRKRTVEALRMIANSSIISNLVGMLEDNVYEVSNAATNALTGFGDLAIPQLMEVLENLNFKGRAQAVAVLGEVKAKVAVLRLLRILQEEDDGRLILSTIVALGKIGDAGAIPLLIEHLIDNRIVILPLSYGFVAERVISEVSAEALESIDTPQALAAVKKWRQKQS